MVVSGWYLVVVVGGCMGSGKLVERGWLGDDGMMIEWHGGWRDDHVAWRWLAKDRWLVGE